jgi:hypothetical protein
MNRIKSNIVELDKLHKTPCEDWLERFVNGQIDAHEVFKKYGEQYDWLYQNSPYDLIGWQIENGVFDWERYSWAVAKYCPQHFDAEKFNWPRDSWAVAKYCPKYFDPDKFNWEDFSYEVARYCPQHLDPNKYDWQNDSEFVAKFCPDKIVPELFNWDMDLWAVEKYCPDKLALKPS